MVAKALVHVAGLVLVCVLAASSAAADTGNDRERAENAKQVADAWFHSLMSGNTAVATSLSAVPFSFDRKQVVKSLPALKRLYDQIVADKGKRALSPTALKLVSSSPQSVVVMLMIGDEGVTVAVKPGDAFRVVGFSD